MSPSTWLAGARALLRFTRNSGRASAPAQRREHLWVGGIENGTAPVPLGSTRFDVEQDVRSLLGDVAHAARPERVRLEIAVQPGLALRGDRSAFRQSLGGLVQHACAQALVSRVLVTASRSGEWIHVSVSDDGIGADRRMRQLALRPIERLVVQQGGSLEVASWPDQGTTVLTRWPETGPVATERGRVPFLVRERAPAG